MVMVVRKCRERFHRRLEQALQIAHAVPVRMGVPPGGSIRRKFAPRLYNRNSKALGEKLLVCLEIRSSPMLYQATLNVPQGKGNLLQNLLSGTLDMPFYLTLGFAMSQATLSTKDGIHAKNIQMATERLPTFAQSLHRLTASDSDGWTMFALTRTAAANSTSPSDLCINGIAALTFAFPLCHKLGILLV